MMGKACGLGGLLLVLFCFLLNMARTTIAETKNVMKRRM